MEPRIISVGKLGTKGSKKISIFDGQIIKLGNMKKAAPISSVYASMPKSESRKLRKVFRANGFNNLASARRAA